MRSPLTPTSYLPPLPERFPWGKTRSYGIFPTSELFLGSACILGSLWNLKQTGGTRPQATYLPGSLRAQPAGVNCTLSPFSSLQLCLVCQRPPSTGDNQANPLHQAHVPCPAHPAAGNCTCFLCYIFWPTTLSSILEACQTQAQPDSKRPA